MTDTDSEVTRKEVFRALVTVQDEGTSVAESRTEIAARYGIDVEAVVGIEREGIANKWDPL